MNHLAVLGASLIGVVVTLGGLAFGFALMRHHDLATARRQAQTPHETLCDLSWRLGDAARKSGGRKEALQAAAMQWSRDTLTAALRRMGRGKRYAE